MTRRKAGEPIPLPGRGPVQEVTGGPTVVLPDAPRVPSGRLEDKTVVIYGAPKIGKSTLASEWGPRPFFIDTEGGLAALEVYATNDPPCTEWPIFLAYSDVIVANPGRFTTVVIDTVDALAAMCSRYMMGTVGLVHEAEADWGLGWKIVRQEFTRALARLAAVPDLGLVMISHAKDVEIKTNRATYNKATLTLTGGLGSTVLNLADLILHCGFEETEQGEQRVIHTKPSRHWEGGERGKEARLPAVLPWPLNGGFDVIKEAWYTDTGGNHD